MTLAVARRRIATYERVSSTDQRERQTIKTQSDTLEGRLALETDVEVVARYQDDGISGTIPLANRPSGGQMLRDAAAGRFDELWVVTIDRLGRDAPDVLLARRRLALLGVRLMTPSGECHPLAADIEAVVGDYARVTFLANSARGMARAAREGRHVGGIIAFGYVQAGLKQSARIVPDEEALWGDLSSAAIVRQIYDWLALKGWTCPRIAAELNALGVPTHYARDRRSVRGRATQAIWRSGRIANLVRNPVYRGEKRYGVRSSKPGREIISAPVEGLVSAATWHAAQATLDTNRVIPKNTKRVYLLRGAITCSIDGLSYVGSRGRGDVLDELDGTAERDARRLVVEAESITLARRLETLDEERQRTIRLAVKGIVAEHDLRPELDRIKGEQEEIRRRLEALNGSEPDPQPDEAIDLLSEVRTRLGAGLTAEERNQIIRLLAKIAIHTETHVDGTKHAWASVEYRFPAVVETDTGIREGLNYTIRQRVIELPPSRYRAKAGVA